jgi:hypothetical protein
VRTSRCRGRGCCWTRLRAEVFDCRGFVLLRRMPVEDRSIAKSAAAYWVHRDLFRQRPLAERAGAFARPCLRLRQRARPDQSQSAQLCDRGTPEFHIGRRDVVALLSLRRARSGGLSKIVGSLTVHNVMAARQSDLLGLPYQPFSADRCGEAPEGKAPFYEAPIFNEYAGYVSVLDSRLHIGSAQRFPEARRLTPEDIVPLAGRSAQRSGARVLVPLQMMPPRSPIVMPL